jgi:hypothetical protein
MSLRTTILNLLNRSDESLALKPSPARFDYATEWNPKGQRFFGCDTNRVDDGKGRASRSFTFYLWAYTFHLDIIVASRLMYSADLTHDCP